ncbi:hypothetical protein [Desulfovibrio sp. Huiquan2017]|uniref:hypothetical protein n=1 Tax=Desulfovibrio sp. Huiquan2017 TaxID=2816861 RepID=UPI001A91E344|nr:hypothetical protein [Desulfovibrio sp. Huiquan2017]
MKRRELFRRFIPFGNHDQKDVANAPRAGERPRPPLTENERFLRAMALGIDPATVTPGQLDTLISESEPSTTL